MKVKKNEVNASLEKLLKIIQDKETTRALKRLIRIIDSLPANWTIPSEISILLDCSTRVFDSWAYLSKHPEVIREAIQEVKDPLP